MSLTDLMTGWRYRSLKNKPLFEIFRKKIGDVNKVECLLGQGYELVPGFWPLMDENRELTSFVAIGNKMGVPPDLFAVFRKFKAIYGSRFTYLFSCQSGPYLTNQKEMLLREFDGIFDTDYLVGEQKKIDLNHSMMVRSMPYEGFFWETDANVEKTFDFSMLTWGPSDKVSKRWDRGSRICRSLCEKGLKGLVVTQRGISNELITDELAPYVERGLLTLDDAHYTELEFHHLMDSSRVTLFPNHLDAFPKFIIESLLADRRVVISHDLLLGRAPLSKLGTDAVLAVDFDNSEDMENCAQFVQKHEKVFTRKRWLDLYGFDALSSLWAKEINEKFGTHYEKLFFLNHLPRIDKANALGGD